MWAHLWADQPAPIEYLNLILYREFGWSYKDASETPAAHILEVFAMLSVEAKAKKLRGG